MPLLKIKYLLPILFCVTFSLKAQTVHVLTNSSFSRIETYEVVPDNHYNVGQIHGDTRIPFRKFKQLNTRAADYYWLKVVIDNPYPNNENYHISLSLPLNYTFCFFDTENRSWRENTAGSGIPDHHRERGVIPYTFRSGSKDTLYFKLDVRDIQSYAYPITPSIILEQDLSFNSRENMLWLSWLVCIVILICFLSYNLYIYFHLKDPVYLCYLVLQIGAIIFITSFKHYFNLLFPFRLYNMRLDKDGSIYYYGLNAFLLHVGAMIIVCGIIQLTRAYLRTKELLPVFDKVLKCLFYFYMAYELVPAVVTITGVYYLDSYTLLWDNVFIVLIALTIILTCIIAHKRRVMAARHFLLANTVPIILLVCVALYFIANPAPTYINNTSILPELAILSQIFTFAVALTARMRVVNEELKAKDQEVWKLEADIALTESRRTDIEKENELIIAAIQKERDKNEALQQQLEINQRELVGNSLYIHQKNKLLAELKTQIEEIDKLYPNAKHPGLKTIKSSLYDGEFLDAEWDKFKLHFEQVHPGFFENLRASHPSLTRNELRLYAYFHINLSTKEIAALLNIEPASVRQAKARLNKKINNPEVNN